VFGHEIVGKAVRVGSKVSHIRVGDRVGIGAQADSCLGRKGDCEECSSGLEQHCPVGLVGTYDAKYMNGDKFLGGLCGLSQSGATFRLQDSRRCPVCLCAIEEERLRRGQAGRHSRRGRAVALWNSMGEDIGC
jgi:alcohol dehydrogenase (NADP+)